MATTRLRYGPWPGGPPTGSVSYSPETATTPGKRVDRLAERPPAIAQVRTEREQHPPWRRRGLHSRGHRDPLEMDAGGRELLRHRRPQLAHGDRHRRRRGRRRARPRRPARPAARASVNRSVDDHPLDHRAQRAVVDGVVQGVAVRRQRARSRCRSRSTSSGCGRCCSSGSAPQYPEATSPRSSIRSFTRVSAAPARSSRAGGRAGRAGGARAAR